MSSKESKKKYQTVFTKAYSEEYSFIIPSKKDKSYAFCTICTCDFSIASGGRYDICKHIARQKHQDNARILGTNKRIDFVNKQNDHAVIQAESLFTAFIVEHNLPIACADHAGPLFRKMFPDSEIAKKYGCARTKTSAIIAEMGKTEKNSIICSLKKVPFSIATDGSNKGDFKLYPLVVTFHNDETERIESSLLSTSVLEGDSTGVNIANLILNELKTNNIPLENCLALSADNAPVMIGKKAGVAGILSNEIKHLVVIGCPCHLIDLAAEKGASCFPTNIEDFLIDIYFYLEKSSKRKEKLKMFQSMHDAESKKILKHVCTRWLSLSRCLARLVEQWNPLISFLKAEIHDSGSSSTSILRDYKIPKLNQSCLSFPRSEIGKEKKVSKEKTFLGEKNLNKIASSASEVQKKENVSKEKPCYSNKRNSDSFASSESKVSKLKKIKLSHEVKKSETQGIISREERLFLFISSDFNKALCFFLLHTLPLFEIPNTKLQSTTPHIHILRKLLLDMLKTFFSKFLLPSIVKSANNLLDINYKDKANQKSDSDLVIGYSAFKIVETLKPGEKEVFFSTIRLYFTTVCDYMKSKFPFESDILLNAEVAGINSIVDASFTSLKFFIDKFPCLLTLQNMNFNIAFDLLQSEFCAFQMEDLPDEIKEEKSIDIQWSKVGKLVSPDGKLKYEILSKVMIGILTIPHSNAECERIFSLVTKTHTKFRSSLSNQTLGNLLTVKSRMQEPCFKTEFDVQFLKRAKSATTSSKE